MRYSVSDTAEYGDYSRGSRVLDDSVDENMKKILKEVQSGEFAREWISENETGLSQMKRYRQEEAALVLEKVGKQLREMMGWLPSHEKSDELSPTLSD